MRTLSTKMMQTYPISSSNICPSIKEEGDDGTMTIKGRSLKYAASFLLQ